MYIPRDGENCAMLVKILVKVKILVGLVLNLNAAPCSTSFTMKDTSRLGWTRTVTTLSGPIGPDILVE